MQGHRIIKAVAIAGTVALATTACLSSGSSSEDSSGGEAATAKKTVEIMYGFSNEQGTAFKTDVSRYAKTLGVTMKYSYVSSFDTLIRSRVQGNNAPDLAMFPQPGVLRTIAETGKMQPFEDATVAKLKETVVPGFIEGATFKGKTYGAPGNVSVKSLVWYDKPAFKAAGYTIPKTIDELNTLTDKIRTGGKTPWCIGVEAGTGTGWVITDWVEDLVLRYGGVETYDKWVAGETKFSDPVVKQAFEEFGKIALTPGNVLGGRKGIVSNPFITSGNPMFKKPPGCYLHRQATFIQGQGGFPDAVRAKLDTEVGVFPFPPAKVGEDPVLVAGDLIGSFTKDTNVTKIRDYIASAEFGKESAKAGFFSPHKNADVKLLPNNTLRQIAKILYGATAARFDGSDVMPPKVGAGSFWRQPVAWVSGSQDLDATLKNIDASFPKS